MGDLDTVVQYRDVVGLDKIGGALSQKAQAVSACGAGKLQIVEAGQAAGVGGFGQGARDTACTEAHGNRDVDTGDGIAVGIQNLDDGNLVTKEISALHIGLVRLLGDLHGAGAIAQDYHA